MIPSISSSQKNTASNDIFFMRFDTSYQMMHFLIRWVRALGLANQIKPNLLRTWPIVLLAIVFILLSVACGTSDALGEVTQTPAEFSQSEQTSEVSKIKVQTTNTVLADMVRVIGGEMVEVTSIVPAGADVHIYQVSPSQMIAISEARLLVSNGLGLDDFLNSELDNSKRADVVHVVASQGLTPEALEEISLPSNVTDSEHHDDELAENVEHLIHETEEGGITPEDAVERIEELLVGHEGAEEEHHEDAHGRGEKGLEDELKEMIHEVEDGHLTAESAIESMEQVIEQHHGEDGHRVIGDLHGHDSGDPHFWLNPILAIHYVKQISEGLIQVDPANAQVYSANTDQYTQELLDLDQEITKELSQVPPEHRHLITFHDAYGYFVRKYGWDLSAFVPVHGGDVTPQAIAGILNEIQEDGIPAVFSEPQFAEDVLQETAKTGGIAVGTLRSLVDDTEPTYLSMMRSNVKSLVENLK